ncbi:MAG TPA: isochorismate synthase [Acidimicrobiia bacterium]|jgi:isochorismate synthase|nr:isochorismate synthase [Acidimicrobiia bacterium]
MLLAPNTLAAIADQLVATEDGLRFAVVPVSADPLAFVRAAAPVFGSARYVASPGGVRLGSVGTAWRAHAQGLRRFERLEEAWRRGPEMPAAARLMLGFAFSPDGPRTDVWDGFAASELVLPEVTVIAEPPHVSYAVVAVPPGAEPRSVIAALADLAQPVSPRVPGLGDHSVHAIPPGAEWCVAVEEAVAAIEAGSLRKVVLARSVAVDAEMTIDAFEMVHHLGVRNPQCHIYGWQVGDATLIGASPELLVGTRDGEVRANPLAGSAKRGIGDEEDRRIGAALLSSEKDRVEHALVVEDIASRLRPLTVTLDVPAEPSLSRAATVQHLSTQIRGSMRNGTSLLGLAGQLHPTPAVGGTPRQDAIAFIDKVETIDRGWYSGGVGWLSPSGEGDVAVALRCALVSGRHALLFAGNGIVADSNPQAELVETRWKLGPLLNLLTEA